MDQDMDTGASSSTTDSKTTTGWQTLAVDRNDKTETDHWKPKSVPPWKPVTPATNTGQPLQIIATAIKRYDQQSSGDKAGTSGTVLEKGKVA